MLRGASAARVPRSSRASSAWWRAPSARARFRRRSACTRSPRSSRRSCPGSCSATARALGAARGRAALAGLVVAVIPETAVGLFALTPDLLLAPAWLGVLALAAVGHARAAEQQSLGGRVPRRRRSSPAWRAPRRCRGCSCSARSSSRTSRPRSRMRRRLRDDARAPLRCARIWPWAGLVAGLVVRCCRSSSFEAKTGWPMLRHRFVDTQHDAGAGVRAAQPRRAARRAARVPVAGLRASSPCSSRATSGASALATRSRASCSSRSRSRSCRCSRFCVWSPVAEPHWIAPAFLVLPLHAARRVGEATLAFEARRMFDRAASIAALLTLVAHAWVLAARVGATASRRPPIRRSTSPASSMAGRPRSSAVKEQMATAEHALRSGRTRGGRGRPALDDLRAAPGGASRRARGLRDPGAATTSTRGSRARNGAPPSTCSSSPTIASPAMAPSSSPVT